MNAIYTLLDQPNGPLILFLFIIAVFGLIALDTFVVCLLRKRIQQKTDTYDVWVAVVCGSLVELILVLNMAYHFSLLLK